MKIQPHNMKEGQITSIIITDVGFTETVEIAPIPFDIFSDENTTRAVSLYYLKKKKCENLLREIDIARAEFEEAKQAFESLMNIPGRETKPQTRDIKTQAEPSEPVTMISKPEEPSTEPSKTTEPESVTTTPSIIIDTPAPPPLSLEEITTSIIASEEFNQLIQKGDMSSDDLKSLILSKTKPDLVDSIHDMIITQLKEQGRIESSILEKITRKVRGRRKITK